MKKTLLTLLLLSSAAIGFGQKISFTDNTNVWNVLCTYHNSSNIVTQLISYSYGDDVIVDSVAYKTLGTYYVREDQAAKKVYIRYNDSDHGLIDNEDRVLYDYNLKVNDTVTSHQFFGDYTSWVTDIDSTKINGTWHKVWHFTGAKSGGNGYLFYNVIEGIGCTNGFDYPVNTPEPDGAYQLVCFMNNGINPELSTAVPSYGMYYASVAEFDNKDNCPLGIEAINTKTNNSVIFPNPIDESSKVVLPYTIKSGSMTIIDQLGKVITSTFVQNKSEITLGNNIHTSGVYLYRVTDNESGKVFSGRFVY